MSSHMDSDKYSQGYVMYSPMPYSPMPYPPGACYPAYPQAGGGPKIIRYTIKPGDTLWNLANQYDTTVDEIMAYNPGIDPYNLQVGQTILIPDPPFGFGGGWSGGPWYGRPWFGGPWFGRPWFGPWGGWGGPWI